MIDKMGGIKISQPFRDLRNGQFGVQQKNFGEIDPCIQQIIGKTDANRFVKKLSQIRCRISVFSSQVGKPVLCLGGVVYSVADLGNTSLVRHAFQIVFHVLGIGGRKEFIEQHLKIGLGKIDAVHIVQKHGTLKKLLEEGDVRDSFAADMEIGLVGTKVQRVDKKAIA